MIVGYLWGAILTLGVFIAGGIFQAGMLTQRVKALEEWRQELRADLERWRHEMRQDMTDGFNKLDRLIRDGENDT